MDGFVSGELHDGVVRAWSDEEGWGVVDCGATPGGCWTHFSSVVSAGYRRLALGASVRLTVEAAEQDGYRWRAVQVWPPGVEVGTCPEPDREPSDAYSSVLSVTVDGEPVDPGPLIRRAQQEAAQQRLAVLDAFLSAAERRDEVLRAIAGAEHAEQARDRICELLDVDPVGASAVLDLQLRRFTRFDLRRVRNERGQVLAEIEHLEQ